jgi:hypothetical protein
MLFVIVRSALPMRDSSRSMIASSPLFCSISRPDIEMATAAWAQLYSAPVNTSDGEMFSAS